MRKHFVTLSVSILVLSALMVLVGCGDSVKRGLSPNQKALLSLLPGDATSVVTVNFQKLAGLKLFEKQVDKFNTKDSSDETSPFATYQGFIDKLGIDFKKDLIAIGFAGKGKMKLSADPDQKGVFIVQLNFDKSAALNILKEAGEALTQETHEGVPLFTAAIVNQQSMALAFIDDQTVVMGTPEEVKSVIDLSKGKGKSIIDNPKFKPHFDKLRTDSVGSAVFTIPEEDKKAVDAGMIKMDMSKAEAVIINFDYTGSAYAGELVLISHDAEANQKIVSTIDSLRLLAAAAGPEVNDIIKSFDLRADANSVTAEFSIPTTMLEKLQKKMEEKGSGSGSLF